MSCPNHPQWIHSREDCPLCPDASPLYPEVAYPPASPQGESDELWEAFEHALKFMGAEAWWKTYRAARASDTATLRQVREENARLTTAMRDILEVIANDELIPESVSYMRAARAAVEK